MRRENKNPFVRISAQVRKPIQKKSEETDKSKTCNKCGGLPLGSGAGRFLGRECMCDDLAIANGDDESWDET